MTKLIPVTKWNDFHIWPTEAGLRYYIFNAEFNGFDQVIRRVGRRILIDENAFFKWTEQHNKGAIHEYKQQ